jgi:DNA-binding NarL/FixJ family response regulator
MTAKRRMIAKLVSDGLRNGDIAVRVGMTENSVKNIVRLIFDELGFHNRVELAMWHVKQQDAKRNQTRHT